MNLLATTGAADTAPVVDVSTALALIFGGLVVFLLRALAKARREIDHLQLARTGSAVTASPAGQLDDLPAHLQVVIAAAVFVALEGAPAQIVSVTAPENAAGWALEGRRDICRSHRVR